MSWRLFWLLAVLVPIGAPASAQAPSYLLFESGQVRPLALTPPGWAGGTRLLAVNTPDNRLEIFDVGVGGLLTPDDSVQVGMEPVAVAARVNGGGDVEAWVVNHLSDSVSIVRIPQTGPAHVVRTLLVGDEPRDVVFAGTGGNRAFITAAHRGQNHDRGHADHLDPRGDFTTEGIPRADVWVFDADALGSGLGGDPETVIGLFGDKPRALAASDDGTRVYAAVFRSGNQSTALNGGLLCETINVNGGARGPCTIHSGAPEEESLPGGYPPPHKSHANSVRPESGLILHHDRPGSVFPPRFQDELQRNFDPIVRFDLPDRDVFEIDATLSPPAPVNATGAADGDAACADGSGCWSKVGATLFNMAVRPGTQKVFVTNSDARNHVRFEGPGTYVSGLALPEAKPSGEKASLVGDLARMRISVLDGASITRRRLNKHIDYSVSPAPAGTADDSLSTPLGMDFDDTGSTLYVAAFGSRKIAVLDPDALEGGPFNQDADDHIELSGGGPSGVLYHAGVLYVLTRFDNSVAVVDPDPAATTSELQKLGLYDVEDASITDGRELLYDARLTSSNGEASCASCHLFGDMDDLAWDLGNPDEDVVANDNPFDSNSVPPCGPSGIAPLCDPDAHEFHPMKGPMTTQSLRGLANMGPQHWRGDRQGNELVAFKAFDVAFAGLLGRATEASDAEMTAFADFALQLRYPPNPIRELDNSLRSDEADGAAQFVDAGDPTDGGTSHCAGCHEFDAAQGFFGGDGETTFDAETQHFKVPHLRNMYQKVGMFGMAAAAEPFFGTVAFPNTDYSHQGAQIRGYGFTHDGSVDTLFRFHAAFVFDMNDTEQADMEAFMMAFDSDLAPVVGQQVTLTGNAVQRTRASLLEARAGAPFTSQILGGTVTECDLIAWKNGTGYLYDPGQDEYVPDDGGSAIAANTFQHSAGAGDEITLTCAPPGSGMRMGLDRDEDALGNGVETGTGVFVDPSDTGTDPANADTDGDGIGDGDEVVGGSDPNDPLDPNGPKVPLLSPFGLAVLAGTLGTLGALRTRRR